MALILGWEGWALSIYTSRSSPVTASILSDLPGHISGAVTVPGGISVRPASAISDAGSPDRLTIADAAAGNGVAIVLRTAGLEPYQEEITGIISCYLQGMASGSRLSIRRTAGRRLQAVRSKLRVGWWTRLRGFTAWKRFSGFDLGDTQIPYG